MFDKNDEWRRLGPMERLLRWIIKKLMKFYEKLEVN